MDKEEKEMMIDYINSHYEEFKERMNALDDKEYVLAFIELLKLIIDGDE